MTAHSTALGIASLGRHGDDVLVHMSRDEVKGLQALAKQNGTSLTINPHTGMPEAFSLGKVFGAILPIAAGFALGPGGIAGGMFDSALTAGLAVGGITAALTGNLGQGLMAGLGAGSGFGLSDIWSKMGSSVLPAAGQTTANMNANALLNQGVQTVGTTTPGFSGAVTGMSMDPVKSFMNTSVPWEASAGASTIAPSGTAAGSTIIKEGVNLGNTAGVMGTSAPKPGIMGAWDRYKDAGGTFGKLAMPIGSSVLAGVEPSDFYADAPITEDRMKRVYKGMDASGNPIYENVPASSYSPYETLNLNDPYANYPYVKAPPSLKLLAVGGAVNPTSSAGGISDLYSMKDGTAAQDTPKEGYGIARLDNLASQESMNKAKTLGYADGGSVAPSTADIPAGMKWDSTVGDYVLDSKTTPASSTPAYVAATSAPLTSISRAEAFKNLEAQRALAARNVMEQIRARELANLERARIQAYITPSERRQYADGGSVTPGSDLPSDAYMSDIQRSLMGSSPVHYTGATAGPAFASSSPYGTDMIGEMMRVSPEVFRYDYGVGRGTSPSAAEGFYGIRRKKSDSGFAQGGIADFSAGGNKGYLDGPGDGMSDSIPATIEGKQPARLADGEFVVPADVVSHIGNGSSKAGSKRLYAMLDKVRKARTGHTKQGKQIKPEKYMPV